ncbi:hypothetical protein [Acinetobacter baumannii]|uniref:hypothetical protein n=1 Tax=Acinetobacter baumannii TaxID=470 RepID=UPI000DCFE317|nr:hypothetical protein [Acinetobacter baumannii]
MKTIEKNKIQKNIETIQNGNFSESNIESLFMNLRPYCKGYKKFREIADFVAHNDARDRGIVNKVLEDRYLILTAYVRYLPPNKPIDLLNEFPSWIIRLIKNQCNLIDKKDFLKEFKFSRTTFLEKLDTAYIIDHQFKIARYSNRLMPLTFWNAVEKCLSICRLIAPLTQDEVINEIIGVLKTNRIIIKENLIRKNADKIIMCILLLLHKTEYKFEDLNNAETFISDNPHYSTKKDMEDNTPPNLYVAGRFVINGFNGQVVEMITPIFTTNLKVEEWCDLRVIQTTILQDESVYQHIYLDDNIILDEHFKISKPELINNK